jgi:hypothetical protein
MVLVLVPAGSDPTIDLGQVTDGFGPNDLMVRTLLLSWPSN